MKNIRILLTAVLALTFSACSDKKTEDGNQFHITGHITGAKDSTLVLEANTLDRGIQQIATTKLGEDGSFSFSYADTISNPEFYRLRIADQFITLSIDSTETVSVEAQWPGIAFNYKVEGSGNCDTIRILSAKLQEVKTRINALMADTRYTLEERGNLTEKMLQEYKDSVKINFVQNRYEKASSYYALFQNILITLPDGSMVNYPVFDNETNASDVQWVYAIANAWSMYYPGTLRSKQLEELAIRGRKNTRQPRQVQLELDGDKVTESGIIDMGFPDLRGTEHRLSSLKGKVVLLDFTAYTVEGSQERIMKMRNLYDKYHSRGFEIYQVSLDPDEHRWRITAQNLPWICVYCEEGVYSDMIALYRVEHLGTYFLIDRNNDLVDRAENIKDLERAIERLL